MSDVRQRIEAALKRRDDLNAQRERALGRLQEAEKALFAIRDEIKAKNIDPSSMDETIARLERALGENLAALEDQISVAENALKPFTRT